MRFRGGGIGHMSTRHCDPILLQDRHEVGDEYVSSEHEEEDAHDLQSLQRTEQRNETTGVGLTVDPEAQRIVLTIPPRPCREHIPTHADGSATTLPSPDNNTHESSDDSTDSVEGNDDLSDHEQPPVEIPNVNGDDSNLNGSGSGSEEDDEDGLEDEIDELDDEDDPEYGFAEL